MNIFSGLFKSRDKPKDSYDSPSYSYFFGRTHSGKRVNDRTALQHIIVYACVRVLSEAIAQLPFHVYKYTDITRTDYKPGDFVVIDGIEERIERITEVDINSFEDKYGNYLSQEQVAREYFVSTGTVTSWIKKGKIIPSAEYKFGSRPVYLFSPEDVEKYRTELA